MRWSWVFLSVFLFLVGTEAASNYREFTGANGKKLHAKLLSYNAKTKKVSIKCKGRDSKTVPISLFSKEDQDYILDWVTENDFLKRGILKTDFQKKEEKDKELSVDNGFDETIYRHHWFDVTFENRSSKDFKGVEIEYVLFYSQEDLGSERTSKIEKEGVYYGKTQIDLPKKSATILHTDRLFLFDYSNINNGWEFPDMKGHLNGIILKIHTTLSSGKRITRTVSYPKKMKREWTTEEKDVQRHL